MAGVVDKSVFAKASSIKDALSKKEAKEVADLYKDWAGQIGELADYYDKKPVPSAAIQSQYYQQLKNQVTEWSKQVTNGVYDKAGKSMNIVADAVVADNAKWMSGLGFSDKAIDAAFSNIPQSTVNSLLTGSVYGGTGSWSLSKAIWGDNQDTLKHVYQIVAQGAVMQMPTGDIARKLEQYVDPSKQFKWNGPEGYPPIYGKKVDYNAQRLVRTLTQHTYQQSVVATAKSNPLIEKIRWVSNGSRVCPLCMERDGKVFAITNVPLDHPNGQCVLEPVVNWDKLDELADWVNEPDGTYPWWDNKMQAFGYTKGGMPKSSIISNMKKAEKASKAKSMTEAEYNAWKKAKGSKYSIVMKEDEAKKLLGDDVYDAYVSFFNSHEKELYNKFIETPEALIKQHIGSVIYNNDELDALIADKLGAKDVTSKLAGKVANNVTNKAEVAKELAEEKAKAAKELAEKQAKAAEKLKSFKGAFKQDVYTDEAKQDAKKFANRIEADKFYRKGLDKTWEELAEDQKFAVWKYTENSNPMNKVLSGYANGSWDRKDFVGVGKADWNTEDDWRTLSTSAFKKKFGKDAYGHVDHAKAISDLTTAIDHTISEHGMHLRRGSDANGLAGLLDGDLLSFDQAKSLCKKSQSEMQKALVGQVFDNHSFMSTGISEDAGFGGNVSYSIYAPKGTRYIYAEPQSYYGGTIGHVEKIYETGQSHSSVESEAEIILQRGTSFRITNVKKFGPDIHIDMEVVAQPDYFKTGYEQTIDGGATIFKH